MRRATIRYESFIHFIAPYAPLDKSEVDIAAHQLGSIQNLVVPEPVVLLSLADQPRKFECRAGRAYRGCYGAS